MHASSLQTLTALITLLLPAFGFAQNNTIVTNASTVSVPYELTYLLPGSNFTSDYYYTFTNGTTTTNATVNALLQSASSAAFISYDDEFLSILGADPIVTLVTQEAGGFAFEAGVWVPDTNEVWFTSTTLMLPNQVNILSLANNTVRRLDLPQAVNINGGYHFEGLVYLTTLQSSADPTPSSVISIDPVTYGVRTLFNSYFGLHFNGLDDCVWVRQGNKKYLFITDLPFAELGIAGVPAGQVPAAVWRWDPQTKILLPLIDRASIAAPNGVRVSPDQRTLYVTDSVTTAQGDASPGLVSSSPAIYSFDLDHRLRPTNRQVFGLVRDGIADGIHVDDAGRVWTGEAGGITVRRDDGKVLGEFNGRFFVSASNASTSAANFALAGDTLVFLGVDKLWTIKLGETLVTAGSSIAG